MSCVLCRVGSRQCVTKFDTLNNQTRLMLTQLASLMCLFNSSERLGPGKPSFLSLGLMHVGRLVFAKGQS